MACQNGRKKLSPAEKDSLDATNEGSLQVKEEAKAKYIWERPAKQHQKKEKGEKSQEMQRLLTGRKL